MEIKGFKIWKYLQLWSQGHNWRRFKKSHACGKCSRWFAISTSHRLLHAACWINGVVSLSDVFKSVRYDWFVIAYSRSVDTQLINHILFIYKHFIWILDSELKLWIFLHGHGRRLIIVVFKKTWQVVFARSVFVILVKSRNIMVIIAHFR